MRIIAEWYASPGQDSTCRVHHCEAFEGETVEEVNAAIRARAGDAVAMIVGLRNTRENFEIYIGKRVESGSTFADTVTEGWIARQFRRFWAWTGL